MDIKFSQSRCQICGKVLKQSTVNKGHNICYDCKKTYDRVKKGTRASNTEKRIAERQLRKRPSIIARIFKFINN